MAKTRPDTLLATTQRATLLELFDSLDVTDRFMLIDLAQALCDALAHRAELIDADNQLAYREEMDRLRAAGSDWV